MWCETCDQVVDILSTGFGEGINVFNHLGSDHRGNPGGVGHLGSSVQRVLDDHRRVLFLGVGQEDLEQRGQCGRSLGFAKHLAGI
jgi:hypothetical protein